MNEASTSLEKFLNPEVLKKNLVAASVFLVAYELLRAALIDQPKSLFTRRPRSDASINLDDYKSNVLCLDSREMVACAKWFQNMGALDEKDVSSLQEIADHRNEIAHELPTIITSVSHDVSMEQLHTIYRLTKKVDQWWIREVEIPTDPDFDHKTFTEEEIAQAFSTSMFMMSLLISLAEGNDSELKAIYDQWLISRPSAQGKPSTGIS